MDSKAWALSWGTYGIEAGAAFWFDINPLGFALAVCAVVLVASAEKLKKN